MITTKEDEKKLTMCLLCGEAYKNTFDFSRERLDHLEEYHKVTNVYHQRKLVMTMFQEVEA